MENGIVRIINSRIVSLMHEIEELKEKLKEKENDLDLAFIALRAVNDKLKGNETDS